MKNIYILCFIILMGCKSTETYTDSIERILIKPEQGMEILLSQLVDTLTFVSLETTLNSLLVQIDKLEYDRGKYFILDRYQHSVLIFDSLGGFKTIKFSFIILHASEHRSVNQTFVRRFQRDRNRSVHDFAHRHPYIISYFRNFDCYHRRNRKLLT